MARSVNKATLIGNVGNDPDIRATSGGMRIAKLSLATNTYAGKNPDGSARERTDWHRLTFFGKAADIIEQYVRKGDRIYVEGEIRYSEVPNKDTGEIKWYTEIAVKNFLLLGGEGGGTGHRQPAAAAAPSEGMGGLADDGLPFARFELPF